MSRRRLVPVCLAALLVLSGCSASPPVDDPGTRDCPGATTLPGTAGEPGLSGDPEDPPDPEGDVLGWEAGFWYDESIAVDPGDGLNRTERAAFVARTMARVERIRRLEFAEPVPVSVISRETYRARSDGGTDGPANAWNNQVWEALLLVGEDRDIASVFSELYGGAVQGYYAPGTDCIVVVSDAPQPTVDRVTLAHELVHALQDQRFDRPFRGAPTQDEQLATDGLTEGDASLVEQLYEKRCGEAWDCVERPAADEGGGGIDLGVFFAIYLPYSDGPSFVDALRERGGWAAVDDAYDRMPRTTEQVIHPGKYPEEGPAGVDVPDRSAADWSRFDVDPATDRVGEASIFVMLWRQGAFSSDRIRGDGRYSPYNYVAPASAGWAGDEVVPYRSEDGGYGYVWRIAWDTERDAWEFAEAYRRVLSQGLDARTVDARRGVYRVPETSPFGDAFRVVRRGRTVTVVNAPTVEELDDVHDAD